MSLHVRSFVAAATMILASIATPALAQRVNDRVDPPKPEKQRQFTPFIAMGDDLRPGGGAAFTFGWTKRFSLEAEASLGTDAGRSSFSLLYHLPRWGKVSVYTAGGAGVQRDYVETFVPVNEPFDPEKKTEFAVNVGAGVSVPLGQRWAWRADFRWYNPKAEWPESWRAYYGLSLSLRQ